jgi:hypothetical protein
MKLVMLSVLAVALCIGVASASGASNPQPETMLRQVITYDGLGQYGRAYDLLVPGQKKLVNRDKFIDCMTTDMQSFGSFHVTNFRKIDQFRDPAHVVGVTQKPVFAVAIRYTLIKANGRSVKDTSTWHSVWIGARWAWMLSNEQVAAYRAGRCPS